MKIELRLKQLLQKHNLYRHGVEQRIARGCNLHRHTIGKLIRNEAKNPSLDVLGKVCAWLMDKNVTGLPGALFEFCPSELWKAVGDPKNVSIYIGLYEHSKKRSASTPLPMSVARYDAEVASKITHVLSCEAIMGDVRPVVKTRYVLFRYGPGTLEMKGDWLENDKRRAKQIFKEMRNRERKPESSIILGSQRANYLTECFVADLFDNCEAFQPNLESIRVPFYFYYRDFDWLVPSCFGGANKPPNFNGSPKYGTYFINSEGEWNLFEWKGNKQDGGVVVIVLDSGTVEMAVFGFSGRATNAIGHQLATHTEKFWPNKKSTTVKKKGKEIGVYICCVTFYQDDEGSKSLSDEDYVNDHVKVSPLSSAVLEKYLR